MSVDFSEVYKHAGAALCRWSPDGAHLACALGAKLVVREAASLGIERAYTNAEPVSAIEWSPDSLHLLCLMPRHSLVQVWSLEDTEWRCKIDGGAAGIAHARWSPDSRHVVTVCEFGLRLTSWSLLNRSAAHVAGPKFSDGRGIAFTKSGAFMAVAVRRDCKDFVAVYSCASWAVIREFRVCTEDLVDLSFAPDDGSICVWGTSLEFTVSVYTLEGTELLRIVPKVDGLGVRNVVWSPDSALMAIGSYDNRVRLVNAVTQRAVSEMHHPFDASGVSLIAYRVVAQMVESEGVAVKQTRYDVVPTPFPLDVVKPALDKPNPPLGVEWMGWSKSGMYLSSRNDTTPNALWVWDVSKLEPNSVLVHDSPVKDAAWSCGPKSVLALCTGTDTLCLWSPEGCSCVVIPQDEGMSFKVRSLQWNPANPSILLLLDRDSFCCCYFGASSE